MAKDKFQGQIPSLKLTYNDQEWTIGVIVAIIWGFWPDNFNSRYYQGQISIVQGQITLF